MRKTYYSLIVILSFFSCKRSESSKSEFSIEADSLELRKMISVREAAMIDKNMNGALSQFSDDATWINSQGYFFEGKNEVKNFHTMLAENDYLDYSYHAGKPRVRIIDSENALVYYSWKMFWFKKETPTDTVNKEIGLMTLSAKKINDSWKWIAITNQHTPWFYEEIKPVVIE